MTPARRFATAARARRVARQLATRGLPGLGEALVRLRGRPIGDAWRIDALYAVGAEGAVFTTTDASGETPAPAVVKVPLLPYHRPGDISSSMLRHRREALREEARYLERSSSPYMPKSLGLHEFTNPLLDADREGPFVEPDPALVMERLPGLDVDLWLARIHRSGLPNEVLREPLDAICVMLLVALRDLQDRGFLYADLRPGNLRVTGRPIRRLRLLDAGSLVDAGDASGRFPHVPHYLPPELFDRRYRKDLAIVPSASAQAVMAGRTLYEIATGRVPVPGRPIEVADLKDCGVSARIADVVDGLSAGDFSSVATALKYAARHARHALQPVGWAQTAAAAPTTPVFDAPPTPPTAAPPAAAPPAAPSAPAPPPAAAPPATASPVRSAPRESGIRAAPGIVLPSSRTPTPSPADAVRAGAPADAPAPPQGLWNRLVDRVVGPFRRRGRVGVPV